MSTSGEGIVPAAEFKLMADRAGLGMTQQELDDLKPVFDLYAPYLQLLHSIDLSAEEIGVTFHPDWPPA